jgi:hypothetical protein
VAEQGRRLKRRNSTLLKKYFSLPSTLDSFPLFKWKVTENRINRFLMERDMNKFVMLAWAGLLCAMPSTAYSQGANRPMTDRELAEAGRQRAAGNMIDPYCIEVKLPNGTSSFGCFEQYNYANPKTVGGQ